MPNPPNRTQPPSWSRTAYEDEDAGEKTRKVMLQRVGVERKAVIHTLRVVAGRDLLRFVTMDDDDVVTIGREDTCTLPLSDASVSRRHARLRMMGGQVVVEDLESTNGTAINGQLIERGKLNIGDHLEIGGVSLRLDLLSLDEVKHLESVVTRLEAPLRDHLTGLLNRNYLEEDLPELLLRCAKSSAPISCVFLDLDHFKQVNDRFGHSVGDDALCTVARLMMLGVRDSDVCVRYGGEELLMFLPGSPGVRAAEVAERIRKAISGHDWQRTAPGLRVTASMGVAEWNPAEPIKDWLDRADRSLYDAKAAGRNRVMRAGGPTP